MKPCCDNDFSPAASYWRGANWVMEWARMAWEAEGAQEVAEMGPAMAAGANSAWAAALAALAKAVADA